MNTFKKITLGNWRQFESITIDFDQQVTILTGQNGAGKTTLLNLLGRHFGWNINFISTPYFSKNTQKKLWSDFITTYDWEIEEEDNNTMNVGTIEYSNGIACPLSTPKYASSSQYNLSFNKQQTVIGLNIPSHRPSITYIPISSIPTNPKTVQQQYSEFQQLLFQTYGSQNIKNPGIVLKESLVSLGLFGYGNEAVLPNLEYKELFETFQNVLKKVLPDNIGFQRLEIRMPDVILITDSGQFSLDAMSGGINDIFGMAWQIHMYGADKESCTVLIDEPENHLHPSMQRSFLPSFAKAFPTYKFIIASHSPFIVSSMPEAKVFGLIYNDNKKVISMEIKAADLSGTPNKILREILDVPSNLPIWVEEKIKEILIPLGNIDSDEKAKSVFEELNKLGLASYINDLRID